MSDKAPEKDTPSEGSNLPTRRKGTKPLRPVSPPLSTVKLHHLIYILVAAAALTCGLYTYRIVQVKNEVGSWWGLLFGSPPSSANAKGSTQPSVTTTLTSVATSGGATVPITQTSTIPTLEDHLTSLASYLSITPTDLSYALAPAIHEYVPPASVKSLREKETGVAAEALFRAEEEMVESGNGAGGGVQKPKNGGLMGQIVEGMETVVGLDEP